MGKVEEVELSLAKFRLETRRDGVTRLMIRARLICNSKVDLALGSSTKGCFGGRSRDR